MSGYLLCRSAKRSRVKTTEPLDEFSKGTTPLYALWFCTAEKTSSIVVEAWRLYEVESKADSAACGRLAGGPAFWCVMMTRKIRIELDK